MVQTFDTNDYARVSVKAPWPGLPNLVDNPSGSRNGVPSASGWHSEGGQPSPAITGGLTITDVGASSATVQTRSMLPSGVGRRARLQITRVGGTAGRPLYAQVAWLDANGNPLPGYNVTPTTTAVGGTVRTGVLTVPDAAARALVYVSADLLAAGQTATFRDTVLICGTQAAVTAAPLPLLAEPGWVEILGPSTEVEIERSELQVGTLTATILDANLDPATSAMIRPGREVRAQALVGPAPGGWVNLMRGKILGATVAYELKDPKVQTERKRTRITLSVTDAMTTLANSPRSEGVGTLAELPYVLDGTGVPYLINGSSASVNPATVTVVSRNDQASAVDQVAITRDTTGGYGWVNRDGVLVVVDNIYGSPVATLTAADYTGLDVDFDTKRAINTVTVKHLRLDPATGEPEEVSYGPFVEPASVREWDPLPAEFTVHGIDEAEIPDFAEDILVRNAIPARKVNTTTQAIDSLAKLQAHATRDLYDLVRVVNVRAGIDRDLLVTSVAHRITPKLWQLTCGYATSGSTAPPQVTPSPTPGGGKTLSERLRPVGEETTYFGLPSQLEPGWLIEDGSPYDTAKYPKLFAHLQVLVAAGLHPNAGVLPDMTDLMPIGAGIKAVGTRGGSPTVALPAHTHPITGDGLHAHSGADLSTNAVAHTGRNNAPAGGANAVVGAIGGASAGTHSHNVFGSTGNAGQHSHGGGTGSAYGPTSAIDTMPPWRARYFIIRAA